MTISISNVKPVIPNARPPPVCCPPKKSHRRDFFLLPFRGKDGIIGYWLRLVKQRRKRLRPD
jgi:hypothetical protein